jgi:uncharacterized protein (TIGR02594 family)
MLKAFITWIKNLFRIPQRQVTSEVLPAWYAIAVKEIGVKEIAGSKHNPRIIEYHSVTTLKSTSDEVAWCSAFVNWCLKKANVRGTNLANARSFLTWGKSVADPKKGDICVFWRGRVDSWQGHVGFYAGETKTHIKVLGGNQGNEVSYKNYPKSQLLEFRRLA